jgi:HPt (histidine-containing phosphotransfer) domain-containing protein
MSAILDPAVLDGLRSLTAPGEPDVLSEVLNLFLVEVPPRMDRLRNAWAAGNIEEVHRAAHSLKGSAGNIGANAFFAVCKDLDEKSRSGDTGAIGPLVEAMGVEYGRVQVEIARLIGSSPQAAS